MEEFVIDGKAIKPNTSLALDLPLPSLYTHTPMTMPVYVVRGKKPGARLFVSAAIHGDELNGIEIIRRLLKQPALRHIQGTLVAIPMVNVYGVIHHSRYLPDRRDLNRSFPGSGKGSLAARLAHLFMNEIVANCTHGIDLHTAAEHRSNLPQIRANLDDAETLALAEAFNVPVLLNANVRDGSLRGAAAERGVPMLLYEAGEALRFDEVSIRAGVKGILGVMRHLGMVPKSRHRSERFAPYIARSSRWVRAPASGIFRTAKPVGVHVKKGELLGMVSEPVTNDELDVASPVNGLIIGRSEMPLVHEGEALYHIATFEDTAEVAEKVENFQETLLPQEITQTEELIIT